MDWERLPVRVTSEATDWPSDPERPPRAAVSAFGLSGTNAHLVVEGYGAPEGTSAADVERHSPAGSAQPVAVPLPESIVESELRPRRTRLLPLSGKSDDALRELAGRYISWLDERAGELPSENITAEPLLSDMAWTAAVGRSHFAHRAGVVFDDIASLREGLRALAESEGGSEPQAATRVAFAYAGEGSHWVGMGEELYESEPVARAVLDRCNAAMRDERGSSLLDVMFGRTGVEHNLNDPAWAEPAIYALQCALTALWASVGVRPNAVVAQGSGRIAAAQSAGVFNLNEGLRLAVALGELKESQASQATIATVQTTLDGITLAAPSLPLISSATGQMWESVDVLEIDSWLRDDQVTTVSSGHVNTLAQLGVDVMVGIGPDSTIGQIVGDAWPDSSDAPVVISTLESPLGDGESPESDEGFVRAVARAYEAGLDISFTGLFAGEVHRRISIPTYPFQRRRHWL
jgi:acyl transferase domain-containing protein